MTTIFKTKNLTIVNNKSCSGGIIPFRFGYTKINSGFILMLKIFAIEWRRTKEANS